MWCETEGNFPIVTDLFSSCCLHRLLFRMVLNSQNNGAEGTEISRTPPAPQMHSPAKINILHQSSAFLTIEDPAMTH